MALNAINGQSTAAVSVFATEVWALNRKGLSLNDCLKDPIGLAREIIEAAEETDADIFFMLAGYTGLPVAALGGEVYFPPIGASVSEQPLINSKADLQRLQAEKIGDAEQIKMMWETAGIVLQRIGDKYLIPVNCRAPFTTAVQMVGADRFLRLIYRDPFFVHAVLRLTVEMFAVYMQEFVKRGAEIIYISDPSASGDLISLKHFRDFAAPYLAEAVNAVHQAGAKVLLHICGDITDRIGLISAMQPDVLSVDHKVDLATARDALGDGICLAGNIDPVAVLQQGSPELVREHALACLANAGNGGFILLPGCELALGTPAENIKMMLETARNYKN